MASFKHYCSNTLLCLEDPVKLSGTWVEIFTLSISSGYLVTRCIGLNRKLLIGKPAVRGSAMHCCSKSRNAWDCVDLFCSSVQAFSWRLHHRMCGFNSGILLIKMSPIWSTHMLPIRSLIINSLYVGSDNYKYFSKLWNMYLINAELHLINSGQLTCTCVNSALSNTSVVRNGSKKTWTHT